MKKIEVTVKETGVKFIAYLIKEQETKFITVTESKNVKVHYPLKYYSFVIL